MSATAPIGFYTPVQQNRLNFALLGLGFSFAIVLRFGTTLTTRRLRGTDGLAAASLVIWMLYLVAQAVDVWYKTVYGAPLNGWSWVIASVTLCYSTVLCAICYMSVLRVTALFSPDVPNGWRQRLEWAGVGLVALIFITRAVRTILIFINTANGAAALATLTQNSTNLQLATFLPSLGLKAIFDVVAMYKLHASRVKYVAAAGQEAFRSIVNALFVEIVLLITATIVAFQEALNYSDWKLSFFDWILFSWCLASWIDQRKQFAAIFGSSMTGRSSTGSYPNVGLNTINVKPMGSINQVSQTPYNPTGSVLSVGAVGVHAFSSKQPVGPTTTFKA